MSFLQWLTAGFLRALTGTMFRVDASQLAAVPRNGPLIVVTNHVHIPEIPTLFTRLLPRRVRGMALAERVLAKDLVGRILRLFGTIPVWRGEADLNALRIAIKELAEGNIILLDPEGTRSHDGCLQRGKPGAILMALHSGAPLLPIVHYGSENFKDALKRLQRKRLTFVVGKPFMVENGGQKVTSSVRRQMIDEVMTQMARLLPPQYRGVYADLSPASPRFLRFINLTSQ